MFTPDRIYRAPPHGGAVFLGRTVPSLLDESCDRTPNAIAFNQWTNQGWQLLSNHAFRQQVEALGLGLQAMGLQQGDRMVLLLENDLTFCQVDMACLLAGFVTVPINIGETLDNIGFMVSHSGAKALILSEQALLEPLIPYLETAPALAQVLVVVPSDRSTQALKAQVVTLQTVQQQGEALWSLAAGRGLRSRLSPQDLATIIYVAGPTGKCKTLRQPEPPTRGRSPRTYVCEQPKGVMLTHENLTANALAAFSSITGLQTGPSETVLLFLPLTHIFARVLFYGHLAYGHSIYFSTPLRVVKHLQEIQPTIMATVPRLLEKVHTKIVETGCQLPLRQRWLFDWAMQLAQRYRLGQVPTLRDRWERPIADRLVFKRWRTGFGQRLTYLLCGGAALDPNLAHWYAAIGLPVMQGYGLTQTSAVLSVNRGDWHRAGTVGKLIPGVEVAIAPDHEILVRAPYVMAGYYHNPGATRAAIEPNGWFHTGDLGHLSEDGYLTITGHKKSLFKLSTGKYVMPEPMEHALRQSPFVTQAIAVGNQRPYCAILIFPSLWKTRQLANQLGLSLSDAALLHHPQIRSHFQTLIDRVNQQVPTWSTVKRFELINATLTPNNDLLADYRHLNRPAILQTFANQIEALYGPTQSHCRALSDGPMMVTADSPLALETPS